MGDSAAYPAPQIKEATQFGRPSAAASSSPNALRAGTRSLFTTLERKILHRIPGLPLWPARPVRSQISNLCFGFGRTVREQVDGGLKAE